MCERNLKARSEFVIWGQCTRTREALVRLLVLIRCVMLPESDLSFMMCGGFQALLLDQAEPA